MSSLHALPLRVRVRQLAMILTRHGLGYLIDLLGLEQFVLFIEDGSSIPVVTIPTRDQNIFGWRLKIWGQHLSSWAR